MKAKAHTSITAVFAASIALTACGNAVHAEPQGNTGVSLNESGEIVVHVQPCGTKIDHIAVNGEFDQEKNANPVFAEFEAENPLTEPFTLNTDAPQTPWRAISPPQLPDDPSTVLLIDSSATKQNRGRLVEKVTGSVALPLSEIEKLTPGEIFVGWHDEPESSDLHGRVVTEEQFLNCPSVG